MIAPLKFHFVRITIGEFSLVFSFHNFTPMRFGGYEKPKVKFASSAFLPME